MHKEEVENGEVGCMCDGASLLVYGESGEAQCGEQAESRIRERLYGLLDFDSRGVE